MAPTCRMRLCRRRRKPFPAQAELNRLSGFMNYSPRCQRQIETFLTQWSRNRCCVNVLTAQIKGLCSYCDYPWLMSDVLMRCLVVLWTAWRFKTEFCETENKI